MKQLLSWVVMLMVLFSCSQAIQKKALTAPSPDGGEIQLRRFSFMRGGSMIPRSWEIVSENGVWRISENGGDSRPFPEPYVQMLIQALQEYNVIAWKGFHDYDPNVLDGEAFSLEVEYADGTSISASGENAFPEGYFAATSAFDRILRQEKMEFLSGVYRYAGALDQAVTITMNRDGTWLMSAGFPGKAAASGEWSVYDDMVYMTAEDGEAGSFMLGVDGNALILLQMDPDAFPGLKLAEGGWFLR